MPFFDDSFTPPEEVGAPAPANGGEEIREDAPSPAPRGGGIRLVRSLFDYVEIVAITFCVVLLATLFLFRHAIVDGDSMKNTLNDREHLIISGAFYTPEVGDIVVFEHEDSEGAAPLVKRVIAVAGQTVEIRASGVWVDGVRLQESYAFEGGSILGITDYLTFMQRHTYMSPTVENGEEVYRWVVEDGYVFVMGDNRFNSLDSRTFGPIREESILGQVLLRVAPLDQFGKVE